MAIIIRQFSASECFLCVPFFFHRQYYLHYTRRPVALRKRRKKHNSFLFFFARKIKQSPTATPFFPITFGIIKYVHGGVGVGGNAVIAAADPLQT